MPSEEVPGVVGRPNKKQSLAIESQQPQNMSNEYSGRVDICFEGCVVLKNWEGEVSTFQDDVEYRSLAMRIY